MTIIWKPLDTTQLSLRLRRSSKPVTSLRLSCHEWYKSYKKLRINNQTQHCSKTRLFEAVPTTSTQTPIPSTRYLQSKLSDDDVDTES